MKNKILIEHKVPENYFETLEEKVFLKIKQKKAPNSFAIRAWKTTSAVAASAALLVGVGYFLHTKNWDSPQTSLENTTQTELMGYMAQTEMDDETLDFLAQNTDTKTTFLFKELHNDELNAYIFNHEFNNFNDETAFIIE